MDPTNPIIQLCTQGVEAESARRFDEARTYFEQAWRTAVNDVEACIAPLAETPPPRQGDLGL